MIQLKYTMCSVHFFTPGLQSAFLTFGLPSAFYPQSVYV